MPPRWIWHLLLGACILLGSSPPAAGSDVLLRLGSRGEVVRQLQMDLEQLGCDPGPVDGIFGPLTEAAVRRFQREQGITADGMVGPVTRQYLRRALAILAEGVYVVQPGDTLLAIARHFGVPWQELARENRLPDPDRLLAGQALFIPTLTSGHSAEGQPPEPPREQPEMPTWRGRVALTFDDSPHATVTRRLLQVLARHQTPATFFIIGSLAEQHVELLGEIARAGHLLGNHSWSHVNLTELPREEVRKEIERTAALIRAVSGQQLAYFRPPHGALNETVLLVCQQLGHQLVLWSNVGVRDHPERDPSQLVDALVMHAHDGAIIMLHDGRPFLPELVDALIPALRQAGFRIVSLSQLRPAPPLMATAPRPE